MIGKIIKGVGGFYYVHTKDGVYECHAKGAFRNKKERPLVGSSFRKFRTVKRNTQAIFYVYWKEKMNSFDLWSVILIRQCFSLP